MKKPHKWITSEEKRDVLVFGNSEPAPLSLSETAKETQDEIIGAFGRRQLSYEGLFLTPQTIGLDFAKEAPKINIPKTYSRNTSEAISTATSTKGATALSAEKIQEVISMLDQQFQMPRHLMSRGYSPRSEGNTMRLEGYKPYNIYTYTAPPIAEKSPSKISIDHSMYLMTLTYMPRENIVDLFHGGLCREANNAITEVYNAAYFEHSNHDRSFGREFLNINRNIVDRMCRQIESAFRENIDINQMAKDNVWPMFFDALFATQRPSCYQGIISYKKENAKQAITAYKQSRGFSKKQWKTLCNRSKFSLYVTHENNLPDLLDLGPNFRNDALLNVIGHRRQVLTNTGFFDWAIEKNCFQHMLLGQHIDAIADFCDVAQFNPEIRRVFGRLNHMNDFERTVRHMHRVDMRSPFYYYQETSRLPINIFGSPEARPSADKKCKKRFACLKHAPDVIEVGNLRATLLDSGHALYEEGSNMKHCIYTHYSKRIENGTYVAYHVEGKGCDEAGYTAGFFRSEDNTLTNDQIRNNKNLTPDLSEHPFDDLTRKIIEKWKLLKIKDKS